MQFPRYLFYRDPDTCCVRGGRRVRSRGFLALGVFVGAQNSAPSDVARGRVVGLVRLVYIPILRLSFAGFLGTGAACLVPLALGPVVWHLKSPLTSIAVPVEPLPSAVQQD